MAGGQDDDTDKTHEATQHKLDEARKKGEFARSADLNTAAAYGGFLLAAMVAGADSVDVIARTFTVLMGQSASLAQDFFNGGEKVVLGSIIQTVAIGFVAWFILPATCVLASVFAQKSMVFAPSKLSPKLSRINPIQNARNKYGMSGLFEFSKSFAKLVLYSILLAFFLKYRLPDMAGSLLAEPKLIGALAARMLMDFMFVVLAIALGIGALDYLWHYFEHLRKNRMSHQEVKDEYKQNEGDPQLKQERRQRAMRKASEQMVADVQEAEVVIMNPTHFAVALKWSREPGAAPVCIAKGVDHLAMTIRDVAMEHGVPIRQDPPTARALFATTEIGQEIDPSHFRAVAAAIRFAETMRRRAKEWT